MTNISVDVDENRNIFILSGDIDQLLENRRAKIFLKDFLNSPSTIVNLLEEEKIIKRN